MNKKTKVIPFFRPVIFLDMMVILQSQNKINTQFHMIFIFIEIGFFLEVMLIIGNSVYMPLDIYYIDSLNQNIAKLLVF